MKEISATNKGLITGIVMVLISFGIYWLKKSFENNLQYIVYTIYIAGILWTLISFKKTTGNTAGFKDYFSQGFKCFIVVTLIMVLFTWTFIVMHPELKEQMTAMMRTDLLKEKDLTPIDIDSKIANAKKMFLPAFIMGAVFGYLVIGTLISAIAAGFLSQNKQNNLVRGNGAAGQ